MCKKEFSITDRQEVEQFLSEMNFVFLGTINEDGFLDIIPLNFVYYKESDYFTNLNFAYPAYTFF